MTDTPLTGRIGAHEIQIRRDGSRWCLWSVERGGKPRRITNTASPSRDAAKRMAEAHYGTPVGGWKEIK